MLRRYLNRVTVFLLIYFCYLGALTLAPFDFSMAAITGRSWGGGNDSVSGVVLNTLGFVPFGVIIYFFTRRDPKKVLFKSALTAGAAATVAFSIETGQMFLPTRVSSVADLAANTVGGGLGFWGAHQLREGPWIVLLRPYWRKLILFSLTLYIGSLIGLFFWIQLPQTLKGWNPHYPLLIGNEATLDRPWLGKIFLLALYDRVLTADEIETQFVAGPHFEPAVHLKGGPIALYPFQEARGIRVHDRSPVGVPLHLQIIDPQKAIWLPKGGLELTGPSLLRSRKTPENVYHRFTATDTFSVVAWIEPKDTLQAGPARIVSFSVNPSLRNFTLGQEESEIHFRVRNRVAGRNGTRRDLRTKGLGLRPQPTHVVAIYDRGTEQLYINGVLFSSILTQDGFTLIARVLDIDAGSRWQRALLVMLVLGPIGASLGALKRKRRRLNIGGKYVC